MPCPYRLPCARRLSLATLPSCTVALTAVTNFSPKTDAGRCPSIQPPCRLVLTLLAGNQSPIAVA